jgi:hypothetical protein
MIAFENCKSTDGITQTSFLSEPLERRLLVQGKAHWLAANERPLLEIVGKESAAAMAKTDIRKQRRTS